MKSEDFKTKTKPIKYNQESDMKNNGLLVCHRSKLSHAKYTSDFEDLEIGIAVHQYSSNNETTIITIIPVIAKGKLSYCDVEILYNESYEWCVADPDKKLPYKLDSPILKEELHDNATELEQQILFAVWDADDEDGTLARKLFVQFESIIDKYYLSAIDIKTNITTAYSDAERKRTARRPFRCLGHEETLQPYGPII